MKAIILGNVLILHCNVELSFPYIVKCGLFVDIDECLGSPCDESATCSNTAGSFSCACNSGFSGNGTACSGMPVLLSIFRTSSK